MVQDMLTVKEAADALRMSPRNVRHLVAKGEIAAFRAGRKIIIPHEAVLAYLRPAFVVTDEAEA